MKSSSDVKNLKGDDLIAVLKKAVEDSGLSLNQIAKQSGLSQSQLSRFVNGDRTLSLTSASKLFETLGLRVVLPSGIVEPSEPEEPPPSPAKKPTPKKPKR